MSPRCMLLWILTLIIGKQTQSDILVQCSSVRLKRETICERLQPYFSKFKYKMYEKKYRDLIDKIVAIAEDKDLSNNQPLSPRFLEGYYNQRYVLIKELDNDKKGE